jgi:predicted AAA+ superfamily ATPase
MSGPRIPRSDAAIALWRHLTANPGQWYTGNDLATAAGATYRTTSRILKLMAEAGLLEVRERFPAWQYRHLAELRAKAPDEAAMLDSLST